MSQWYLFSFITSSILPDTLTKLFIFAQSRELTNYLFPPQYVLTVTLHVFIIDLIAVTIVLDSPHNIPTAAFIMAKKNQDDYGTCSCCQRWLHKKTIRSHATKQRKSTTISARAAAASNEAQAQLPPPDAPIYEGLGKRKRRANRTIGHEEPQVEPPVIPEDPSAQDVIMDNHGIFRSPPSPQPVAGPSRLPLESTPVTDTVSMTKDNALPAPTTMRHRYATRLQNASAERWRKDNNVLRSTDMFNLDDTNDQDDPDSEDEPYLTQIPSDEDDSDDDEDDVNDHDVPLIPWNADDLNLEAAARAIDEAHKEQIMMENYDARTAEGALTDTDLDLLRPYILKVEQHLTEKTFSLLRYAYPTAPHSTLKSSKKRVRELSRFDCVKYDCCVDSCVCFVGPYAELDKCPICSKARYTPKGKPRKVFQYLPLIPRLHAMTSNLDMAKKMQYRSQYVHKEGQFNDVFDGTHYRKLRNTLVRDQPLFHFSDPRDIALGLSTDGFGPFKRRKHTCWPIILFNYNIPPEERMQKKHILNLGTIPGPKKPKDWDSFCYPLVQELLDLELGVKAFDPISRKAFNLHAYLILAFGDMPAVSLITRMKGQNGRSPCRFCKIKGRIYKRTYYVPLKRSTTVNPTLYDPANLPMRTQEELDAQIAEIDAATTQNARVELEKEYGVRGKAYLTTLSSISIPNSFPLDFMHLIWENLIPNLIEFWTGQYKDIGHQNQGYVINPTAWKEIGELTAKAGQTIPSSYGARVPNIATHGFYMTAETYSNWTLFIVPIVLRHRLASKYYKHFMQLRQLILKCISFNITGEDLQFIETGFQSWVQTYERYYYMDRSDRLSACPLTIHSLLHIADGIRAAGPVSCYWAFPMERHCGTLLPAARSKRHPYVAINNFSTAVAQLDMIRLLYQLSLSLEPDQLEEDPDPDDPENDDPDAPLPSPYTHHSYPGYYLLAPAKRRRLADYTCQLVLGHLVTRFSDPKGKKPGPTRAQLQALLSTLPQDPVIQYGRVKIGDEIEQADQIVANDMSNSREDSRDSTWAKYIQLVDENARNHGADSTFDAEIFYGQLKRVFILDIPAAPEIHIHSPCKLFLALMKGTKVELHHNMYTYSEGSLEVVDLATLKSVVGRMQDRSKWYIIDRT
ncbi:hypothetical protein CVT24_013310 [Panaeolus cyanescens]|uniref:Transposase family Tnp2 protein n=1 Tax=Panaeolus cyanescens TaxID=181874 RepID=A0A409YMI5_9AGAR|nr:hypothetical protein CVT24_013310 [Panaeolus cyanescens]